MKGPDELTVKQRGRTLGREKGCELVRDLRLAGARISRRGRKTTAHNALFH